MKNARFNLIISHSQKILLTKKITFKLRAKPNIQIHFTVSLHRLRSQYKVKSQSLRTKQIVKCNINKEILVVSKSLSR